MKISFSEKSVVIVAIPMEGQLIWTDVTIGVNSTGKLYYLVPTDTVWRYRSITITFFPSLCVSNF